MRKLFISADMEGCSAVTSQQALLPERFEWAAARRWMTQEVAAVCESALRMGYDEVIVADGHGNAHNIEPDGLPEGVWLVRSWPRPLLQMQGMEDPAVDACAFIGYHAASGTADSVMAHSFHGGAFRSIRLNGRSCSEGYLNAALAGEFGRPVVLVSGDAATVEEARVYAPGATRVTTKQSLGWRSQMALSPSQVCRQLRDAAAEVLVRPPPQPFVLEGPFELEVEMINPTAAEILAYLPAVERRGAWSVAARFERIESVVKFVSFATFYSPTGVTL